MIFSTEEMTTAFNLAGFEVRKETVVIETHYNGLQSATKEVSVWMVYDQQGRCLTNEQWMESMAGFDRLKWVFDRELKLRAISRLFS